MINNIPALGACFDINKAGDAYGINCWTLFWHAIEPEQLKGALLFSGDMSASIKGSEGVYCIVVQTTDLSMLDKVKDALSQREEFKGMCAKPMFIENERCVSEPLPAEGRIDSEGNLVGKAAASRSALGSVRKERAVLRAEPEVPVKVPLRVKPASERTRQLPKLSSFDELRAFIQKTFTPPEFKPKYEWVSFDNWMTPEELCDIVEKYADLIEVQFSEGSCSMSEDLCCVMLFQKYPPEGGPIELIGLYPFPSADDAIPFLQNEYGRDYANMLPTWAGIQGKYQLNFGRGYENPRSATYDKDRDIHPHDLWNRIYTRRKRLGIPEPAVISEERGV